MRLKNRQRQVGRFNHSGGFGVIEILAAVGVISLILTALASAMALSLRTSAELKFRSIALSKAQGVIEALRRERAIQGWETLSSLVGGGVAGTYTYCFNSEAALQQSSFTLSSGSCTTTVAWDGNDYIRELTIDTQTAGEMSLTAKVYWQGRDKHMEMTQTLYQWH
ncbi:MAG TPA: hypothetical protein DEP87_01775 [Candidatus Pacebacteria bacterium]|nr:hypothetical protein [Candidatus Paceibacterota bacterium]